MMKLNINELMISNFKKAVDRIIWPVKCDNSPELIGKLKNKYEYKSVNYTQKDLIEIIKTKIKMALNCSDGEPASSLFARIAKHFNFQQYVLNENNKRYINVAHYISDMTRSDCVIDNLDNVKWDEVLDSLKDMALLAPFYRISSDKIELFDSKRESAVGNSLKLLMNLGCKPFVEDGDVYINEADTLLAAQAIDKEVKRYGGLNLLSKIHTILNNRNSYDPIQNRFHIFIYTDMIGHKTNPSLPLGYLFNLSLKHPTFGEPSESTTERLDNIINLSTSLVSALDVEPFIEWETEFKSERMAIKLMQEIALLESNFKIPQIRFSDIVSIIEKLFGWIKEEKLDEKLPVNLTDIVLFAKKFIEQFKNSRNVVIVKKETLFDEQFTGALKQELFNIFVHNTPPNQKLISPTEWNEADAIFKPLIKIPNCSLLLPCLSWSGVAFLEATMTYFRSKIKDFDSRLGFALETLLKAKFKDAGIDVKSGEYACFDGKSAEIDLCIGNKEDLMVLLEIKKKPLTRLARSGVSTKLLIDVAKSLIDSQIQMLRHEISLYKNGVIKLNNGDVIIHNNRSVERISVVFLDFGGLQDRTIIRQLLPLFYNSTFTYSDGSSVVELNDMTKKFSDIYDEWVKCVPEQPDIPFFNCWFISIPQLFLLLDGVSNFDDFKKNLWKNRNTTLKTLDFYYEYKYMRDLYTK